ncbi:effector-associated constant component EACC1 [Streptomyces chilikensis]|uniref:effector-associated constant component EACC1 n=1 Tax=Streptomyces chilikensis TaxID=1194079 RepID=UPI00140DA1E8|nr:hypothetical protein [Streptomyces chilikensis]
MRVTLAVEAAGHADPVAEADDLYAWLREDPELRAVALREPPGRPDDGEMGALYELVTLLLEPEGTVAVFGAAVVAWLQTRRGNQTVTIRRPDGTRIVVSSERVRGLSAEGAAELARQIVRELGDERDDGEKAEEAGRTDGDGDGGGRRDEDRGRDDGVS